MGKDKEVKDFFKERNLPYKNKDDSLNQEREADCRKVFLVKSVCCCKVSEILLRHTIINFMLRSALMK